jgi:hypothetical protein
MMSEYEKLMTEHFPTPTRYANMDRVQAAARPLWLAAGSEPMPWRISRA